jgi:hypothetical protein
MTELVEFFVRVSNILPMWNSPIALNIIQYLIPDLYIDATLYNHIIK